jgi:hypothetical protein
MIELWMLPTIIDTPGTYRTRGGETVTIESVEKRFGRLTNTFNCKGQYSCGIQEGWHHTGRLYTYQSVTSKNDIIEKVSTIS